MNFKIACNIVIHDHAIHPVHGGVGVNNITEGLPGGFSLLNTKVRDQSQRESPEHWKVAGRQEIIWFTKVESFRCFFMVSFMPILKVLPVFRLHCWEGKLNLLDQQTKNNFNKMCT